MKDESGPDPYAMLYALSDLVMDSPILSPYIEQLQTSYTSDIASLKEILNLGTQEEQISALK